MTINDIVKNGKVDIAKMKLKNGRLDPVAMEILSRDKPVVPTLPDAEAEQIGVKINRERIQNMPDRLPTFGMLPFPTDEHAHIGLYETKQNIYLTFAHAYNKAMERIEILEQKIRILEKK